MRHLYFAAFVFVGLALGPALAHLFELPNKMTLGEEAYFTVQQIYAGWAMFGFVVVGALLTTVALAVGLRHHRRAMMWAAAAFLAIVVTQVLFWTFTFPANQATTNWTVVPENWRGLRMQWEYSHAAAALLNFAALLALVASLMNWTLPARRAEAAEEKEDYSSNSMTGSVPPRPISSL